MAEQEPVEEVIFSDAEGNPVDDPAKATRAEIVTTYADGSSTHTLATLGSAAG